ncbi:MAG: CBS domain-containing protein [Chloroflexi bacterium]|nr:CBS domain-containing protein [Chloroflexota bacterium]
MSTVQQLIESKMDEANYSVASTDTVLRALQVMAKAGIGSVLVTENGRIVGIYTERDYARKGELMERSAKETLLKEVMTGGMYTVTMDTSIEHCMALMQKHRIRHLPVVEDSQLVGMVSLSDVMRVALMDRELEIKGLENYLQASGFAS